MNQLLQYFILLPLIGFLIMLAIPAKKEKTIAGFAFTTIGIHTFALICFIVYWLTQNSPVLESKHMVFYKSSAVEIFIDFYFDKTALVFALVGDLISLIILRFSKFYMHRDRGYKLFFSTLLLFFTGYYLIIFSGNFETLFIGWEFIGLCSFLLISFYKDRYLPVKNGLKVISIFRLGDIFLLLAMWFGHHLWHQNITYSKLNDIHFLNEHLTSDHTFGILMAFFIVMAALVKSAQFPFTSWLPRAMEGPTTSSAIFYGSLSVHIGVFLLLRSFPLWENMHEIRYVIIISGVVTFFISSGIARVQSTVKTQIAYFSAAQIGLMFIEIALGWHTLALVHFAGNAFLRTYQLLVSPSVLSYLTHDMFYHFNPTNSTKKINSKLSNTIYLLNLKEWNMDNFQYHFLWKPFKWLGNKANSLAPKSDFLSLTALVVLCVGCYYFRDELSLFGQISVSYICSAIGFMCIIRSFNERLNPIKAWSLIFISQLLITLSLLLVHDNYTLIESAYFISGPIVSSGIGYYILRKINRIYGKTDLNSFHGYSYKNPNLAFAFLLVCLATVGFPITPSFVGLDLIFNHTKPYQIFEIITTTCSFLVMEIAVLRIYARIFLGPNHSDDHPVAYRSS